MGNFFGYLYNNIFHPTTKTPPIPHYYPSHCRVWTLPELHVSYKYIFLTTRPHFSHILQACNQSTDPFLLVGYEISSTQLYSQGRTLKEYWNAEANALTKIARDDIGPGILEVFSVNYKENRYRAVIMIRWEGCLYDYLAQYGSTLDRSHIEIIVKDLQDLIERLHKKNLVHGALDFYNILYRMPNLEHWQPQFCLHNFIYSFTPENIGEFNQLYADVLIQEQTFSQMLFSSIYYCINKNQ